MEIKVSQNVSSKPCEVLVVNKFEGENTSVELANQYAVEKDHFEGKFGETYLIHTLGQIPADKVLIIGFGKKKNSTQTKCAKLLQKQLKNYSKLKQKMHVLTLI